MGRFNREKVSEINLSIYSFEELEDLILKMAKFIQQGYKISTISDFTYNFNYGTRPTEPIFTIGFSKNII